MPEGIEPISQVQNRSHYEAGCMAIFSILDCIDLLGTLLFFIWHLEWDPCTPILAVQNRSLYEAGCTSIFSILDCIDPLCALYFYLASRMGSL